MPTTQYDFNFPPGTSTEERVKRWAKIDQTLAHFFARYKHRRASKAMGAGGR